MVELVEYSLAVMVSALLAAASVAVYASFAGFQSGVVARNAFSDVTALASEAVSDGSASSTLLLPDSNLTCAGGVLKLNSSSFEGIYPIAAPCSFSLSISSGRHDVHFWLDAGSLMVAVG